MKKKYLAAIMILSLYIPTLNAQESHLPLDGVTPIIYSPGIIWKFVDNTGKPVSTPDSMLVYSQILTAINGEPISGYTWALSIGSTFPPGVTVEPLTGILKGTGDPLIAGNYKFIMTVSDDNGNTSRDTINYSVITDSGTVDFYNSSTRQDSINIYSTGNPFSFTGIYFAVSIGAGLGFRPVPTPLTWSIYSGSLPPGLVLDQARGVIRGTPDNSDAGETYSFRIEAKDKAGRRGIGPDDSISVISLPTSIQPSKQIPQSYKLEQNYPNPFNPSTTIKYTIPNVADANFASATNVQLKVYDILGRETAVLVNEKQKPGYYVINWDASSLPSGVYFYSINAGNFTSTKKMVLLK